MPCRGEVRGASSGFAGAAPTSLRMGLHDFTAIVTAAGEGAEWAWSALYHAYAPRLRGYLRARGAHDVDGLLGDVMVQVATNLGRFEGTEASFRSWLFIIAHNRTIDERRRLARRPEVPLTTQDRPTPGSAESDALEALGTAEVFRMLEVLTDEQRSVLALRIVADLSLEETARVLNRSVGAVKQLQRRALLALHRHMSDEAVTP